MFLILPPPLLEQCTTAPSPTPSSTERLRVLALSGGGFQGTDRSLRRVAPDIALYGNVGAAQLREIFLDKSQRLFGTIELATPSHVFPLSSITVNEVGRDGVVLVGESAHAFPPIGAQGLNLGLRDVDDLAAALAASDRSAGWASRVSSKGMETIRRKCSSSN